MLCFPRPRKFPFSPLTLPVVFSLASGAFFYPYFISAASKAKLLKRYSGGCSVAPYDIETSETHDS